MDYIFSTANPRISSFYYGIAIVLAMWLGTVLNRRYERGHISKKQAFAALLLIEYVFLVFASTVFSRIPRSYYDYKLMPFWSYKWILAGSKNLFWECVFNVIMLLPMGILLPMAWKWANSAKRVVAVGFLTSATIEVSQLIFKRGLFEFDDMFHNSLGVLIGYWLYLGVRKWHDKTLHGTRNELETHDLKEHIE